MRSILTGLLLLSLSTAGCKKEQPAPPPLPAPVAPEAAAPTRAQAPQAEAPPSEEAPSEEPAPTANAEPSPPPAVPDAELPGDPFIEGLPGWLGVAAVKPGTKPQHFWTPQHPRAQAVLFSEQWKDVPEGAQVKLASLAGVQTGTYLGTSTERYGCEENTATMAAFSAPQPLPEGPVWVLPPESVGIESLPVRDLVISDVPAELRKRAGVASGQEAQARAYEAGDLMLVLARKGRDKGQLTVFKKGKPVLTEPLEKGPMAGEDAGPLDVTSRDEVGVLHPYAAFRFGADAQPSVVLGARTYEGQNFWVLTTRDGKLTLDRRYSVGLYFCAF